MHCICACKLSFVYISTHKKTKKNSKAMIKWCDFLKILGEKSSEIKCDSQEMAAMMLMLEIFLVKIVTRFNIRLQNSLGGACMPPVHLDLSMHTTETLETCH